MAEPEKPGIRLDPKKAPYESVQILADIRVKKGPSDRKKNPGTVEKTLPAIEEPLTEEPASPEAENGGVLEDPIEILVGLAERGEIDPWNINIIEVTDRFLSELERRRELNLKLSGRTLFYAATLLRMKSEQLLILAIH